MDMARKCNRVQIVHFLHERNTGHVVAAAAAPVAGPVAAHVVGPVVAPIVAPNAINTPGSLSLEKIADEPDNIESIEAVATSEKEVLLERHRKEIAKQDEEQRSYLDKIMQTQLQ